MSVAASQSPPQTLEGIAAQFPVFAREFDNGRPLRYLDSAATAQKPEAVLRVLDDTLRFHNANIHRGVYALAAEATERFEGARDTVARRLGATAPEIVFTRNVTEAINLVAYAWGRANIRAGDRILISQLEHHSNIVPWQLLCAERDAMLEYIPVDDDGRLDLDAYDALLVTEPKLVAVAHVSNVLGTINPIADVVARARATGAVTLVDGAQAVPHLPVDVAEIGADFYGFTGHKVYGPTGIGVLFGRRALLEEMPPFLAGGDMIRSVDWQESSWNDLPWKFEAGTSPYVEGAGLGAALAWLDGVGLDAVHAHEADLTAYALERLGEVPGLRVFGPPGADHGPAISFALEGVHPHDVAEILGRENICIRAGHHCAQPLMRRLGVSATSRASFGAYNTRADVDALCDGLHRVREIFEL